MFHFAFLPNSSRARQRFSTNNDVQYRSQLKHPWLYVWGIGDAFESNCADVPQEETRVSRPNPPISDQGRRMPSLSFCIVVIYIVVVVQMFKDKQSVHTNVQ